MKDDREEELTLSKARKILGRKLSKRKYDFNVPADLEKYLEDYDKLISITKFKNKPFEKHLLIGTSIQGHEVFIYLTKEIVEIIIKSWKKIK